MPSARPKGNKPGPYGYFQRVLMDGARPFSYRPQTNSLLGQTLDQTTTSPVQQLNASQFTRTTLPYTVNENLPDTTGAVIDTGQPGIVQPGLDGLPAGHSAHQPDRLSPSALSSTQQTAAQHNDSPDAPGEMTPGDITVLSWLEQAHASHGLRKQEDPATAVSSISRVKQDLPYQSPTTKQPAANKQNLPENSAVLSDIKKSHHPREATSDDSGVSSPGPVKPSRSIDINLPGKAQDLNTRRLRSSDSAMPVKQTQTLPGTTSSAGNQGGNRTQTTTPHDPAITPTEPARNIHSLYPRQPRVAKVKTPVSPDTLATALVMAKQQQPQSKPLARPNLPVPAPGMPKLQRAIQTGPVNSGPQSRGERVERQAHDTGAPSNAPPQVQQRLVVINQPAQSFSNRPAFWERSYLGRLGPRSYR